MRFLASIPYPENEKSKLELLEKLFREWHQHFATDNSGLEKQAADEMVFDGFYPHYFSQKRRILFIGREALEIACLNYLEVLYSCYRGKDKRIGNQSLNRHKFHARMLHIAYGIVNDKPEWTDIPYASEIGSTFGTASGLSFAFMNLSKLSNESGGWMADWTLINAAYRLSTESRNFIQEEVAILEPHIVITMCLREKIASLGRLTQIHTSEQANSFWLDNNGHRSLLIDTWHFSAPRKKAVTDYYAPICDAIRRSEAVLTDKSYNSISVRANAVLNDDQKSTSL